MLDLLNLPPDFWGSLEFVCIFFGLLPLIIFPVVALLLISVNAVLESTWCKNLGIRTVYVQTDDDLELMAFYASGASPLDLIPDSPSSEGSTSPPYPSTSHSASNSDIAPSTSSQSTTHSASPPEPSTSAFASGESASASSEANPAPKPSSSPTQTTHLTLLPEIIVEHQLADYGASSRDSLDGWGNFSSWSSPPRPPPKIKSMTLKNTSTGNLPKGTSSASSPSSSFQKGPMRMTVTANSNVYSGVSNTSATNSFANHSKPAGASNDVNFFDFASGTYVKSPFCLGEEDLSSSEISLDQRPYTSGNGFRENGSTKTARGHTEYRRSSSSDSNSNIMNGTACKSSARASFGSSSMKSASSDNYLAEVYMGIV